MMTYPDLYGRANNEENEQINSKEENTRFAWQLGDVCCSIAIEMYSIALPIVPMIRDWIRLTEDCCEPQ